MAANSKETFLYCKERVKLENIKYLIFEDNSEISDLSEVFFNDNCVETSLIHGPYNNREPEEIEETVEVDNNECKEESNVILITEYEGYGGKKKKTINLFLHYPVPYTKMIDPISRFFRILGGVLSCVPARYIMVIMCVIGVLLQYTLKIFMSVAIVAMVLTENKNITVSSMSNKASEDLDVCPGGETVSSSEDEEGEFYWSEDIQGYILSSYYYGYAATQLLGGRLSEIYGSKVVMGPGLFVAGLVTVLCPLAARIGSGMLIAARLIVGAGSGVVISSVMYLMTKWFAPEEIVFLGGIILAGVPVGTVISMTSTGVITTAGGWPLSFYIFGGISMSFIVFWIYLIYDNPEKHPRISEAEKKCVLSNIKTTDKNSYPVPWLAILTSMPFWVHTINGIGHGWVNYTLMSDMPTFLSNILHFDLEKSGTMSALPYVTSGITCVLSSYTSNWLRERGYISRITSYRIFNAICSYGSSICLILITFSGCDSTLIVILLMAAVGIAGFFQGGSILNHIDLGSNFAGTLSGIYLTLVTMMGIFSPSVTGYIVNEQETLSQWKIVFYLGAGISSCCCTLYLFFGKANSQHWNILPSEIEENPQEKERSSDQDII
ncbi:hypothetical protein L9F63_002023 [Diploptera punctata]|uniref:Major facilitator superfamily (MFS) profile domain-containing protein n=1 Tax=Diploptera punctata TaxID=6984 RepID=A0AAD8EJ30_DIPPU|nr:hypothetical protein L9F63_002023 [Diploptera punctata]